MVYEYEESNKQIVFTVDNESSMDELNERIKELKVVYSKAKAFDAIRKIEIQSDIKGYHDDTESYMHDVESVIEKYLEDE
ncbi:hypothetical protein NGH32_07215 [Staphylococcus xylosus]|uniref:hypothetical protein n=1 Tax=Staphylococcus xylosus TaxID=1288 RepID=UPI002DB9EE04|nr:hypothetical protein [Staphylococcus xylosus]MEB8150490.1 hypothetical protein [Staphylococcus xylosus]